MTRDSQSHICIDTFSTALHDELGETGENIGVPQEICVDSQCTAAFALTGSHSRSDQEAECSVEKMGTTPCIQRTEVPQWRSRCTTRGYSKGELVKHPTSLPLSHTVTLPLTQATQVTPGATTTAPRHKTPLSSVWGRAGRPSRRRATSQCASPTHWGAGCG